MARMLFFRTIAGEFGSPRLAGLATWRTTGLFLYGPFPVEASVPSPRTPQEICGLRARKWVLFSSCGRALFNRFPGLCSDIKTLVLLQRPILCRAVCGLDLITVASPISVRAKYAHRTQPPTGWARDESATFESIR